MAACSYCNSTVLFGGKQVGDLRFCNDKCMANGNLLVRAQALPASVIGPALDEVHRGRCPVCRGPGPVDLLTSHTVWSALILTNWKSTPRISCKECGTKQQAQALVTSLLFGWWGFPWGFVMTPVQIGKNIAGMMQRVEAGKPSAALERIVRMGLAQRGTAGAATASAAPAEPATDPASLRRDLRSSDPAVCERAISILGEQGAAARDALPELERLLQDSHRSVRARAQWAVESIKRATRQ